MMAKWLKTQLNKLINNWMFVPYPEYRTIQRLAHFQFAYALKLLSQLLLNAFIGMTLDTVLLNQDSNSSVWSVYGRSGTLY